MKEEVGFALLGVKMDGLATNANVSDFVTKVDATKSRTIAKNVSQVGSVCIVTSLVHQIAVRMDATYLLDIVTNAQWDILARRVFARECVGMLAVLPTACAMTALLDFMDRNVDKTAHRTVRMRCVFETTERVKDVSQELLAECVILVALKIVRMVVVTSCLVVVKVAMSVTTATPVTRHAQQTVRTISVASQQGCAIQAVNRGGLGTNVSVKDTVAAQDVMKRERVWSALLDGLEITVTYHVIRSVSTPVHGRRASVTLAMKGFIWKIVLLGVPRTVMVLATSSVVRVNRVNWGHPA